MNRIIISVFVIALILISLGFFLIFNSISPTNSNKNTLSDGIPRNTEMEKELNSLLNEVFNEKAQESSSYTIEKLTVKDFTNGIEVQIELNCNQEDAKHEELLIELFAEKLFTKYPEDFTENSEKNSLVEISGCSESTSSPDGTNTIITRTQWLISDGFVDFRV